MAEAIGKKYSADNLELLHQGFNRLLDSLISFARNNPTAKTKDIVYKLGITDKEKWEKIRETFDDGALYEAYDEDSADPVKVLISIFNSMEECRLELMEVTKAWDQKESGLVSRIEDLKDQVDTHKIEIANLQHKLRVSESTYNAHGNAMEILQNKVEEKDARIRELEREGNVMLWEKEKERAFEGHIAREAQLMEQLESQEKDFKLKCERYEQRIGEAKQQHKAQQMVDERNVETGNLSKSSTTEVNELKKQAYYYAKDLLSAEREIGRLQREISGVLQGVERDFRIVHHRMVDNKELNMKHMNKLADWLNSLHAAFRNGEMTKALLELPDYYRIIDASKIKPLKIRLSKGVRGKKLETVVKDMEKEVWQIETEMTIAQEERKQSVNGEVKLANVEHPQLIYENGKVNTTALIKHFPLLSVTFVQEQWANFKRYDKNGDGTLDLAEMMTAITATLGHRFTALEVVEVMTEVDDDQSSTLDFYEFIKVALIILKKTGKAELFRDEEVVKNKKTLSKTCVVQ